MPDGPEDPTPAAPPAHVGRARLARIALALAACSLLAFLAPGVGLDMTALTAAIDPAQPYLPTVDPLLVYVRLPLSVLGACALVMAPGLLLALLLDLGASLAGWLLYGFTLSLIGLSAVVAAVQATAGEPLVGDAFIALALLTTAAVGAILVARDPPVRCALSVPAARRELALVTLAALVFVVLLAPKLFWESLNGDGAHALEASRLLLQRPLPFWPEGAGFVSAFPGLNSSLFTWPNAWFLRLYGEIEAGVRLPFVLELVALYAALLATIEFGSGRRLLGAAPRALIGLGLASYALVMAYSATYDPYCSDVGLPATQDTLVLVCFLGVLLSFARERTPWTVAFCLLTLLCSPIGPLLLGGLGLGILLGWREQRLRAVVRYGACVVAAFLVTALLPSLLEALGLPAPGGEHDAGQLLKKFEFLQVTDVRRLAFLVVPAGFYPALGLLAWRRADSLVRALIVVVAVAFGTYYAIAFVSLHYFVPAMVLPLAIFWRHERTTPRADGSHGPALRGPALVGCFVLALLAVALGLPRTSAIYTATREVGESVELRGLEGYGSMRPETYAAADLLAGLFVLGWTREVPERAYAGSPLAWNHYAQRAREKAGPRVHLLAEQGTGSGPGAPLAENDVARLFVLDPEAWQAQRTRRPADCRGLGLYALPRDVLFGRRDDFRHFPILDVRALLARARGAR